MNISLKEKCLLLLKYASHHRCWQGHIYYIMGFLSYTGLIFMIGRFVSGDLQLNCEHTHRDVIRAEIKMGNLNSTLN